jgi:hypothetical protein
MEQEKIIDELTGLPPIAQRQVFDFIAFLKTRYTPVSSPNSKNINLLQEAFVGIWKERKEMSDSVSWVRQTRREQWSE